MKIVNRRPALTLIAPSASPAEAAAVVAALERFMRDTAPSPAAAQPPDAWKRAARLQGAGHQQLGGPSPWGDEHEWS